MEDRLIFLYHLVGVMEGRSKSGEPGVERPGRRPTGARQANPLCISPGVVRQLNASSANSL